MASKDWKLPDAQHKITEEKGLDIENESIQRQWEKTIVSLIRLEDAFSDIDVYDDTEEGEIPYAKRLDKQNEGRKPSESAPGTKVYELVEMLRPYLLDTQ